MGAGPYGTGSMDAARDGAAEVTGFPSADHVPDLGDLVVALLASTLSGLRDRLVEDGFERAADLLADLVDVTDDYLSRIAA